MRPRPFIMRATSAPRSPLLLLLALPVVLLAACRSQASGASAVQVQETRPGGIRGWLSWRGPHQNGTSAETGLVDDIEVDGQGLVHAPEEPGLGFEIDWDLVKRETVQVVK